MGKKVKFSQSGEPIALEFVDSRGRRVTMQFGLWVTSVEDHGPSVPEDKRYTVGLRYQLLETKIEEGH